MGSWSVQSQAATKGWRAEIYTRKWILLLLMFCLTACSGGRAVAPVGTHGYDSSNRKVASPPSYYKVQKGDTLYSISWRYGMDYKQLARINGISHPYTIYVGQKLRFTSSSSPVAKVTASKPSSSNTSSTKQVKPTTQSKPKPTTETYVGNASLKWHWPTSGKVISTYSDTSPGRKGIDIAGRVGQPVIAAASGKVVYSGNGLPRYGNLLIIKHNDVYLSAYAHNDKLLVKEGQIVNAGEKIALLGRTGTQQYQLHFEIRRNGKPVDPLRFLPKR